MLKSCSPMNDAVSSWSVILFQISSQGQFDHCSESKVGHYKYYTNDARVFLVPARKNKTYHHCFLDTQ